MATNTARIMAPAMTALMTTDNPVSEMGRRMEGDEMGRRMEGEARQISSWKDVIQSHTHRCTNLVAR